MFSDKTILGWNILLEKRWLHVRNWGNIIQLIQSDVLIYAMETNIEIVYYSHCTSM